MKLASHLKNWFIASRPKTLTAALIPILVGTALVQNHLGKVQIWKSILALLSALCIQIGTNFINDALDFIKGADTSERVGPKRVSQSGLISTKKVWWGGIFIFGLAILLALPLVWVSGWPLILIGIFSILAGYCYTGGPYPLAYLGLGDLFVLIFFGWIATLGIVYLQSELPISKELFEYSIIIGSQIGLLSVVLIAINNLRDISTDKKVGKKTLAVRFGASWAKKEIYFCSLIPYIMNIYWWQKEKNLVAYLPLFVFPITYDLCKKIKYEKNLNILLAQSSLIYLLFGFLLSLGLFLK